MVLKRDGSAAQAACDQEAYTVQWEDLPLSCPGPQMTLWNAHPRVFLSIHRSGWAQCEYCGARYQLAPPRPDQSMPHFDNAEIEQCFIAARAQARAASEGEQ
jgi:uncharacterized Zn-finger protein